MTPSQAMSARAEALFVSVVQFSDEPTAGEVRDAVARSLRKYGVCGCAAGVAQEFGEHPIEAVARMSRVLAAVRSVYRSPTPRRPGIPRRDTSPARAA